MPIQFPSSDNANLLLASLDAVVFDTETTGLDPKKDRVIEIAGIYVSSGKIQHEKTNSILINPYMQIPVFSTIIHGITQEDVADAPDFVEGIHKFAKWAGKRFYIGYSVFFDLLMLEAEFARHDLAWVEPKTLDVEELSRLVAPELPNYALETVADWLGIEIKNRHRALPDAIATAEIFVRLIPLLRDRQITSYAQAVRVCRIIRERQGNVLRTTEMDTRLGITSVDNFIYQNRVQDIMAKGPLTISPKVQLAEALKQMVQNKMGSIFINPENDSGYGILTESDVLQAVNKDGASALVNAVGYYCVRPLRTIGRKEFIYRAIIALGSQGIRHLGVVDIDETLIGALSSRDIFARYSNDAVGLGKEIDTANSSSELGRVWAGLATVARSLLDSGIDARDITSIVSRELRALTRQAFKIAEDNLIAKYGMQSLGNYAVMVLGSGGRGESLLAMDQDNAIIFDHEPHDEKFEEWIAELANNACDILHEAGVKYCDGGVMASNSEWRKNVTDWQDTIDGWLAGTSPEDLLHADIFFDAMPVYGDRNLVELLRTEAVQKCAQNRPFLNLLKLRSSDFELPIGWLGRWKLNNGRIDLKKGGIMPIFSAARCAALEHCVKSRSTADRLRGMRDQVSSDARSIDDLLMAHEILMGIILRQQLKDMEKGIALSNRIVPSELGGSDQQLLRWALKKVENIPNLLGTPALI